MIGDWSVLKSQSCLFDDRATTEVPTRLPEVRPIQSGLMYRYFGLDDGQLALWLM